MGRYLDGRMDRFFALAELYYMCTEHRGSVSMCYVLRLLLLLCNKGHKWLV